MGLLNRRVNSEVCAMICRTELGRRPWAGGVGRWVAVVAMLVGVGCLPLGAQTAQGIAGTWQGKVGGGDGPRVVLTIQQADGGGWKGELRRLDQEEANRAVGAIALHGETLTFTVASIDVSYAGKLSGDGERSRANGAWAARALSWC